MKGVAPLLLLTVLLSSVGLYLIYSAQQSSERDGPFEDDEILSNSPDVVRPIGIVFCVIGFFGWIAVAWSYFNP